MGPGRVLQSPARHLEIHLRRGHVLVSEQGLDLGQRGAGVDEQGGVGVAESTGQGQTVLARIDGSI